MKSIFSVVLPATLKKIILIFMIFMGMSIYSQVSAQDQLGDYRSITDGNWNNTSSWQYFDGTNWVAATGYPGQFSNHTYGTVTIQLGQKITITASATLYSIGAVVVDGDLILAYNIDVDFRTQLFIITPDHGTLDFTNNKGTLSLPDNATLIVGPGGIPLSQSHNCWIQVGQKFFDAGKLTFTDLMNQGGNNIVGASISPAAICDQPSATFTLTATPYPANAQVIITWWNETKTTKLYTGSTYQTPSITVTTTYYVKATYPKSGNTPSYTTAPTPIVAMMNTNTWKGNTANNNTGNNNWSNNANWTCGTPDGTKDAVIPKGSPAPHIDITKAACRNLTIDAYADMLIDAGKGLTINNLTVNGSLTIQSSSESNNGSLIVNGTSNGYVTYNRYVTPGKWFITSSPVNTVPNFDDLNKTKMDKVADYDFAWYVEPNNDGWNYYNKSTSPFPSSLTSGQGYLTRLITPNNTIQFTGELNGDVGLDVTSTGTDNGWNAVGNPFTSALDIKKATSGFLAANQDVFEAGYGAIYIWSDPFGYIPITSSGYLSFSGSGSFSDQSVQAGQGFLINVKADGPGTKTRKLTFKKGNGPNGMQMHSVATTLKNAETSWPGITLIATYNGRTSSTVVAFNENMTTGLDQSYDAGLLPSSDFNLYTHLVEGGNETGFAIQCLPENLYNSLDVPLGLDLPQPGIVTFKASGVILPEGLYPVIEDRLLQVSVPLRTEADSLTVSIDEPISGTGRFFLHIGNALKITGINSRIEARRFTARYADQKITLFGTPEKGSRALLYDINGRKTGSEFRLSSANQNEIPASGLTSGIYLLRIEGTATRQTLKITVVNQ